LRRGYTAVSMVFPILKYVADRGFDPEAFCRAASFDSGLLRDADARIPAAELSRLMNEAAALTGDDHIGLHMEEYMEPADLGVLGYVMMHAGTIREALDAYVRYYAILSDGFSLAWEAEGEALTIRFTFEAPALAVRHCAEDMAVSVLAMLRRFGGRRPAVREVRFMHEPPPDTAPYLETFGVMPLFRAGENAVRLDRQVLDWPILYADERLRAMFETVAEDMQARAGDAEGAFTGRVLEWLRASLPTGLPTLSQAADHFGVSERTLQLKLRAEGATYSELVTQLRRETAIRLLRQDGISIGEIAFLLHYTEPSAFQNAFKKWTGKSPGEYRRQARRGLREAGGRL
jgi:AraC-like DNA-binding protein